MHRGRTGADGRRSSAMPSPRLDLTRLGDASYALQDEAVSRTLYRSSATTLDPVAPTDPGDVS